MSSEDTNLSPRSSDPLEQDSKLIDSNQARLEQIVVKASETFYWEQQFLLCFKVENKPAVTIYLQWPPQPRHKYLQSQTFT